MSESSASSAHYSGINDHKIFISYAKEDRNLAQKIFLEFNNHGFQPWMDKPPAPFHYLGIKVGQDWRERIEEEIKTSRFFFALITPRSSSKLGFIQREFRTALDIMNDLPQDHIYFVPIVFENAEVPNLKVGFISLRDKQFILYEDYGVDPVVVAFREEIGENKIPIPTASSRLEEKKDRQYNRSSIYVPPFRGDTSIKWESAIGIFSWRNKPKIHKEVIITGTAGEAINNRDEKSGLYVLSKKDGAVLDYLLTERDCNELEVSEDFAYFGTDGGDFFCYDIVKGMLKYCISLGEQIHCKPVILDEIVIVISNVGSVFIVEKEYGKILNSEKSGYKFRSNILYISKEYKHFLLVSEDGTLINVDFSEGIKFQMLLKIMMPDYFATYGASPVEVFSDPKILYGKSNWDSIVIAYCRSTTYDFPPLCIIDIGKKDGKLSLRRPTSDPAYFDYGNIRADMIYYKDKLYIPLSYSNIVIGVAPNSLEIQSIISVGDDMFQQWSGLAINSEGIGVIPRNDGYIYQIDMNEEKVLAQIYLMNDRYKGETGERARASSVVDLRNKWKVCFYSTPAIEDKFCYVGTADGRICAVELSKKPK